MTPLLNWLVLIAFSVASGFAARWVVNKSYARWRGPNTIWGIGFYYCITLACIGGLSFAAVSVLYFEILFQPLFLTLVGLSGALKFLLIFAGVWYAALYIPKLYGEGAGSE